MEKLGGSTKIRFIETLLIVSTLLVSLGQIPDRTFYYNSFAVLITAAIAYFAIAHYIEEFNNDTSIKFWITIFLSFLVGWTFTTLMASFMMNSGDPAPHPVGTFLWIMNFTIYNIIYFAVILPLMPYKKIVEEYFETNGTYKFQILITLSMIVLWGHLFIAWIFLPKGVN